MESRGEDGDQFDAEGAENGPTAGPGALPPTTYVFREQGLTQAQADGLAVAKLRN